MVMATDSQFHVLAVDDSVIDRKLIEKLLKTSSCQVTTVDSGSKALEFLGLHEDDQCDPKQQPSVSPNNHQEVEINLIITDYCMPGMTGYDLLRKIKESSSLRNIPVVIMSSENVPSRINRCLQEGAEDFFLKPVRLSDVNKLKPHMMKTKLKDLEKPSKQEKQGEQPAAAAAAESPQPPPQAQSPQPPPPAQSPQPPLVQPQQLHSAEPPQLQANNTKRKAMEEGLSPDRTKRR
ncbi:unnamed protein product [Ilex paraguariensis]|uniref:Response regulatory domain-containing protein n=1 Tax=Ilex paraguariensis TaxID=185542 RepID=A0ABC8USU5_9AQUA